MGIEPTALEGAVAVSPVPIIGVILMLFTPGPGLQSARYLDVAQVVRG